MNSFPCMCFSNLRCTWNIVNILRVFYILRVDLTVDSGVAEWCIRWVIVLDIANTPTFEAQTNLALEKNSTIYNPISLSASTTFIYLEDEKKQDKTMH